MMSTPPVRFIYFDLDDTLLNHRQAERDGLADVCRTLAEHFGHLSLETVLETYHAHNVPLWHQYAAGTLRKEELKRLRFEQTLAALEVKGVDPEPVSTLYMTCYARHWTLPDEARRAFHTLADHFPVGILTNGFSEVQRAKFDRFPELEQRAHTLVVSEDVGYMKPHLRIFEHAAGLAGVPPETILYVGDSYGSDVRGALGAGWQMAWYTEEEQAEAEVFRFREWDALLDRVLNG